MSPLRDRLALALIALLTLAGCSAEPSDDEMRRLVESQVRRQLAARRVNGFDGFAAFRKQGCVVPKDRSAGFYDCYYNATFAATRGIPARTINGKGRFHRTGGALSFEDLGAMPDDRVQGR